MELAEGNLAERIHSPRYRDALGLLDVLQVW